MKRQKLLLIALVAVLNFQPALAQFVLGIEPIVHNEVYVVHSAMYDSSATLEFTSNIYVIKGTSDTVWIFGTGYGEPTDIIVYKLGSLKTTSGTLSDAQKVDTIIQQHFNISLSSAKINFIVPHFHLDHINQEFITEIENIGYNLSSSKIYVHKNDYFGSTCNDTCCNMACSTYKGAPFSVPWNSPTLSKFVQIGDSLDPCDATLKIITTSYADWEIRKAGVAHTLGSLNLANSFLQLKIKGADGPGTECIVPTGWDTLDIHGDINFVPVTVGISSDNADVSFKIFPNPSSDGLFNISTNVNTTIQWSLYDLNGKLIKSGQGNLLKIDIPAIYILSVRTSNTRLVQKIIYR